MKKLMIMVMGLLLCLSVGASAVMADLESEATAHVYVNVVPNVAVRVMDANVDLGQVQFGDFYSTITFRIDANSQDVWISAAASNLYKGNDPASEVDPLPVADAAGVRITPTNANPMNGGSNIAQYIEGTTINGFPGLLTEQINFESSQNNHFSQDVDLLFTWKQPDPEQPQGQYSGFVKMYAMLYPVGNTAE